MQFPDNLRYTKDHEWIKIDGDTAIVGITAFAQSELGDIVYVDISSKGKTLAHEAVFGSVEAVKTVSDLFMPVSGEVLEVNKILDQKPEAVNDDPYGDGWMIKIKMTDSSETSNLLSAEDYKKLIGVA